eukprot:jgi/Tetstr1/453913/TSEL_040832.t1
MARASGPNRVRPGEDVWMKIKPYRGAPVHGVVKDVLTRDPNHPRGVKVRLRDGRVGRVVRSDESGVAGKGRKRRAADGAKTSGKSGAGAGAGAWRAAAAGGAAVGLAGAVALAVAAVLLSKRETG